MKSVPSSLYKYMSAKRGIDFLRSLHVRFTRPFFFNDPFEIRPIRCRTQDDSYEKKLMLNNSMTDFAILDEPAYTINNKIGILSLSKDPSNILMWGHYADSHSGLVIEFDALHAWFSSNIDSSVADQRVLGKLHYSSDRPVCTSKFMKAFWERHETNEWFSFLLKENPIFFTKSDAWSYEKEWRYIRVLERHPMVINYHGFRGSSPADTDTLGEEIFEVPPGAIRSVIIGVCSRKQAGFDEIDVLIEVVYETILSEERLRRIAVKCAVRDVEKYSLRFVDLANDEDVEKHMGKAYMQDLDSGFSGRPMVENRLKAGRKGINPYDR